MSQSRTKLKLDLLLPHRYSFVKLRLHLGLLQRKMLEKMVQMQGLVNPLGEVL